MPESMSDDPMGARVAEDGFALIANLVNDDERAELINALGQVNGAGRRGLMAESVVKEWAQSSRLLNLVRPHLPLAPLPVRAIYFDKSPAANWLVPWHQDLTIAVQAPIEIPGFGPWSEKDGISHVQPPARLLEHMLTIRIHLDAADESNGALRVIPGSHRQGRLSTEQIRQIRGKRNDVLCAASAGDALLMRPLLLHSSGRSTSKHHRRVLHIEYAGFALPSPLAWHEGA